MAFISGGDFGGDLKSPPETIFRVLGGIIFSGGDFAIFGKKSTFSLFRSLWSHKKYCNVTYSYFKSLRRNYAYQHPFNMHVNKCLTTSNPKNTRKSERNHCGS